MSLRKLRQWGSLIAGCTFLVGGIYGVAYAYDAAVATWNYRGVKYGFFRETSWVVPPLDDAQACLQRCEAIVRRYPYNYYFFTLAAEKGMAYARETEDHKEFRRRMGSAIFWDDLSLRTNPYNDEVCNTHRRIREAEGRRNCGAAPDEDGKITCDYLATDKKLCAVCFWRDVVLEREFWNPDRHVVMAELYLITGQYSDAIEELPWLPGGPVRARVEGLKKRIATP